MNNIDFARKLVKGRIAETIFAQMLRDTNSYTVLEFGYEKVIPELIQKEYNYENPVVTTLRTAPDFAVINRETKEVQLVEVKYRKSTDADNILKCAKRMHVSWNPSYLFVATLNGFYFDEISTIIKNNGAITPLSNIDFSDTIQMNYLQLLSSFEKSN